MLSGVSEPSSDVFLNGSVSHADCGRHPRRSTVKRVEGSSRDSFPCATVCEQAEGQVAAFPSPCAERACRWIRSMLSGVSELPSVSLNGSVLHADCGRHPRRSMSKGVEGSSRDSFPCATVCEGEVPASPCLC